MVIPLNSLKGIESLCFTKPWKLEFIATLFTNDKYGNNQDVLQWWMDMLKFNKKNCNTNHRLKDHNCWRHKILIIKWKIYHAVNYKYMTFSWEYNQRKWNLHMRNWVKPATVTLASHLITSWWPTCSTSILVPC